MGCFQGLAVRKREIKFSPCESSSHLHSLTHHPICISKTHFRTGWTTNNGTIKRKTSKSILATLPSPRPNRKSHKSHPAQIMQHFTFGPATLTALFSSISWMKIFLRPLKSSLAPPSLRSIPRNLFIPRTFSPARMQKL